MSHAIAFFGERSNSLGESPLWDGERRALWWVDNVARLICCAEADGSALVSWEAPSPVGSIGLAQDGLIAALRDGFYHFEAHSGRFAAIALPEADNPAVRFNDGKADRQGRFLAGTMRFGGAEGAPGKLYRLETGGEVTVLETGVQVANALCFSPAGDTLYFGDSVQHCVWAYDYDRPTGAVGNRRVLIDTTPLGSPPDGATVDAEGNLWIALVLGQSIACVSPAGRVLRQIRVPVPFPSCPAFGGNDLATLFVTSIRDSQGAIMSDHPNAGRMLAITGLGVAGIAEACCSIPTLEQV